MKYGTLIRLLAVACVAMILLSGCSSDSDDGVPGVPVRIIAEMNGATYAPRTAKTTVRLPEDGLIWKEDTIGAKDYERTVKHVFLFAYKGINPTPEKVIFYYPPGTTNPLDGMSAIDHFETRVISEIGTGTSDMALDLELLGGEYNFVLLVNCESALKKVKEEHAIPDPMQLTEKNKIFTSDDLQGTNRKYLPMTGQSKFHVPDAMGSTERQTLSPPISLERMHARVEFFLTTVDKNNNYLSPVLQSTKVTKLTLENELSGYSVLPSAGEYTATGGRNPEKRGVSYAGDPLFLPERASFHEGANDPGGYVGKYEKRLLPYENGAPKYIYVAPGIYGTAKDGALTLVCSVNYWDKADEPDNVYRVELYNPDLSEGEAGYYNIRRNTTYRVFSSLKGQDMNYNVVVDNWEDVEVAIPW